MTVERIGHRDGFTKIEQIITQTILLEGKPYVVLPRAVYDRLSTLAKAAELPPLPEPDAQGNYPAVEYARASLARKLIRDRVAAGLTQRELGHPGRSARETLCRIETGKHTPSIPTVEKLDRALKRYAKSKSKRCGTE